MSFDEIPENKIEEYPCECGGNITRCECVSNWFCDSCDFVKPVITNLNIAIPEERYQRYLDYIKNSGGEPKIDWFLKDWEPVGERILNDMIKEDIVKLTTKARIQLVE